MTTWDRQLKSPAMAIREIIIIPDKQLRLVSKPVEKITSEIRKLADRVATDWAGPSSRVVRRSLRLAGPVYAGDTMTGRGRAVAKRRDTSVDPPRCLVDIQIEVTNQHGVLCCPVQLTLQLPHDGDG